MPAACESDVNQNSNGNGEVADEHIISERPHNKHPPPTMIRRKWNEASAMSEVTLTPVDPTPDEVQYLEDRIYEFNSSATDIADGGLLAFFVRECDRIVAGICGNTWGGTCELRQFWVDESQRHRGLGTQLFQAAEQEARRRGCTQIVLMTFSFQAPAFYERHGFEVVATIDNHPRGHRNLLMRKRLGPHL